MRPNDEMVNNSEICKNCGKRIIKMTGDSKWNYCHIGEFGVNMCENWTTWAEPQAIAKEKEDQIEVEFASE
jgi:hypothetical protein